MLYLIRSEGDRLDVNYPAISSAPLIGPIFTQDNMDLFGILDSLTQKGPGESIVRKFKSRLHGRDAYIALEAHFFWWTFQDTQG